MEVSYPNELYNPTENLSTFSAFIGNVFHASPEILCNNIFCSVSMALSHEASACKDIDLLYQEDSLTYYTAVTNSESSRHVILSQGDLDNELYAYKALGLLLVSENKTELRKKLVRILRFYYPHIYKTVRKHDFKYLLPFYANLNDFLNSHEARYERAIYFYFSFYCSPDWVDQNMVNGIVRNIYEFETFSPIKVVVSSELKHEQKGIRILKDKIAEKCGVIRNYRDVLKHSQAHIYNMGHVIENLFYINKLDMSDIYHNYSELSMEQIYLACLKQTGVRFDTDKNLGCLLACLFIQPLLEEYKKSKKIIREYRQENRDNELLITQQLLKEQKSENQRLRMENQNLSDEKAQSFELLSQSVSQLKKEYEAKIVQLNHTINDLNQQLSNEYSYRQELNKLREFIFSLNMPPVQSVDENQSAYEIIEGKNIVIIGGPRNWRRKLREHFPMIQFLNGTSSNLDLSYFKNPDCVLFYTNYMSHAIYNKAMNYIRPRRIKFGYLKATNIKLIEAEIIDALKLLDIL